MEISDNPTQPRLYSELAWLWPILSPPADYADEATEIRALIREQSNLAVRTLLHLGCGAGHLDSHWKHEFQVTGVDLSAAMLELARRLNPESTYLPGDMRTLRLDRRFDAVVAADSIEYMTTLEDLTAAFQTAYHHLEPGGVFCTYAEETRERFVQDKTQVTTHRWAQGMVTAIEQFHDPDPDDTSYEMTFVYLLRQGEELDIELDRHQAGLFTTADWISCLEQAGFLVQMVEYEDAGPLFVNRRPGLDRAV
jgi:SAM-dependent methyltransferase